MKRIATMILGAALVLSWPPAPSWVSPAGSPPPRAQRERDSGDQDGHGLRRYQPDGQFLVLLLDNDSYQILTLPRGWIPAALPRATGWR